MGGQPSAISTNSANLAAVRRVFHARRIAREGGCQTDSGSGGLGSAPATAIGATAPTGRRSRRLAAAALAHALAASGAGAACAGPLADLHQPEHGVITSANGEAVWFGQLPDAYAIIPPAPFGPRRAGSGEANDPAERPRLGVHCRLSPGRNPVLVVELVIPRLPDDPAVANWWNPEYWYREAFGRARDRVPVRVQVNDRSPRETTLVIDHTNYNTARPALSLALPEDMILAQLADNHGWTLTTRLGLAAEVTFPPAGVAVAVAARTVRSRCGRTHGVDGN